MLEGKVLYRDLALNYGGFPQYLNALLFKLFGVSLSTLIYANLAILAGITALVYLILRLACDRLTATAAGLVLLPVFAFAQSAALGSMNWVAPYSHAATHGVALAMAMLAALAFDPAGPGRRTTAVAGLCFGCVFLTKPENFLVASALDLAATKLKAKLWVLSSWLALALGAGFWLKPDLIPWLELPRALPLTTLLAGIAFAGGWLRRRRDPAQANAYLALVMLSAFAFGLLSKMLFNAGFSHYGFYLAMPATLVLVVALVWFWPAVLRRRFQGGSLFRVLALVMLALGVLSYGQISNRYYGWKNYPVGEKGDLILGYDPEIHPRDAGTAQALRWIESHTPAEATLVAMPEGTILNYLSRRPNPTPYIYFTMVEMISFGESNMLKAFQAHPPDYVLLVHVSSEDYGVGYFGTDPRYGRAIMEWVNREYVPVELIGDEPLRDERFGIKILQRRD